MRNLETSRLILRPFNESDGPEVERMAGDPEVAATTLAIPHPYPKGGAKTWIATHHAASEAGRSFVFACEEKSTRKLVGCVSLEIELSHRRGMLGYWMGREFWNKGFCTEAVREVIKFGLDERDLVKIYAYHLSKNPASGKVMEKAGMVHEGHLKKHIIKNGESCDCDFWGLSV